MEEQREPTSSGRSLGGSVPGVLHKRQENPCDWSGVSEARVVRLGMRLFVTSKGIVKIWVSLAHKRIEHGGGSRGAQSGGFGNNSGES